MKQKIVLLAVFHFLLTSHIVSGQGYYEKNHVISIAPLSLFDNTVSIKYSSKINQKLDFILNPSLRIQTATDLSNSFLLFKFDDPFWYYNKYSLRVGVMQHNRAFFIEPLIQYEYAYFKNQKLQTEDETGDAYDVCEKLDRSFHSIGLVNLFGIMHDSGSFRFKYFLGLGYHFRIYNETIYDRFFYRRTTTYDPPEINSYNSNLLTLHGGIEIGVRF